MGMEGYQIEHHPLCNKDAAIVGDCYRITVLTPSLIRMEYNENGTFEDRATQSILNRDFPVPQFRVVDDEEELSIYTAELELHYNRKSFAANGLMIKVNGGRASERTWHYGEEPRDLGGTARTLDEADGAIPLGHGVISRNGFSLVDDSHSMALSEDGWVAPRAEGIEDLYFFGYGHRYLECLKDFYYLCGKTPLLPRYALGNWWSRYHRYTQDEYVELVERFEKEEIPFSVAVVDMDWHIVDDVDPKYGSGWTGYTWNKNFFQNPKEFMAWLHEHGLKITLNVHPADGVRAFEKPYERVAKALGMDPASELPVQFDPADPEFMEVYLKELHHSLEEEGVDFWWLDWQQGTVTKVPGLDPLWMLNHYHYLDSKWKGTRSITFSRYAGVGSHRYPVGFSGDTVISWESLQFQPYFTNTASNVGYGWWSHDIGGHMMGVRDDELMARWVQYGVFSPINRLHSTDNPFNGKEPWKFDKITKSVMEEYLRLRHGMVPYLYTMNRRASRDGLPLVQPMYYMEPEQNETYEVPNEYYFGSELIVSPITEKQDEKARAAKAATWLPSGLWADFFTGVVYRGGRMLNLWRGVEDMPVLMKAGAIVPMKDMREFDNSVDNPKAMEVKIFAAEDGNFTLWEDAGDTPEDEDENWAATELTFAGGAADRFTIGKAMGNLSVIPEKRSWKLVFVAAENIQPEVSAAGEKLDAKVSYDKETSSLIIEIPETSVEKEITVEFAKGLPLCGENLADRCYKLLEKAQVEYNLKEKVLNAVEMQGNDAVATLASMNLNEALFGELCEVVTAR
ncbi:MAG: DUF5110 domain-containing protein [Clostridia bacterium]|nr:DUF5110 domain-containing protein [Clostridia bacterium]